jgi:hypothetical protein
VTVQGYSVAWRELGKRGERGFDHVGFRRVVEDVRGEQARRSAKISPVVGEHEQRYPNAPRVGRKLCGAFQVEQLWFDRADVASH